MSEENAKTLKAWNMMRGIEWAALPVVAEIIGAADIELLVQGLIHIREYQNKQSEANG